MKNLNINKTWMTEMLLVMGYMILVVYTNCVHALPDNILSDILVYVWFSLIVLFAGINVNEVLFKKRES